MKTLKNLVVLGAALQLSACASIISGTKQTIDVSTQPQGASCGMARKPDSERDVSEFARVDPTPGQVTLEKTKYDIMLSCAKPGYENASKVLNSDTDATVFGNIILGGLVGWGIDSARGADNKYDTSVNLELKALPPTVSRSPVDTAPLATPAVTPAAPLAAPVPVVPAAPVPIKPAALLKTPFSAPAAAKLAPAATTPNAPAPIATKYPKVAPEPVEPEPEVTGYIAPVPWYKPPVHKPQTGVPSAALVPAKTVTPAAAAAPATSALPVKPQEVSDKGMTAKQLF